MALHILSIGINYYSSGVRELSHCINDAKDWLSFFLKNYSSQIATYKLLTRPQETSSTNILYHFKSMIENAASEDIVIFIFSGHGDINKKNEGQNIILEESIRARDKLIPEGKISDIIEKTNPNINLVSIIDSCFSGGLNFYNKLIREHKELLQSNSYLITNTNLLGSSENMILESKHSIRFNYPKIISSLRSNPKVNYSGFSDIKNKNIILISACQEGFEAWGVKFNNGLLTKYALQVLNKNLNISYSDFILTLQTNINLTSKQIPQLIHANDSLIKKTIFTNI